MLYNTHNLKSQDNLTKEPLEGRGLALQRDGAESIPNGSPLPSSGSLCLCCPVCNPCYSGARGSVPSGQGEVVGGGGGGGGQKQVLQRKPNALVEAWAEWIPEIGEKIGTGWQAFGTFTFRFSKHPEQAWKQLRWFKFELDRDLYSRRELNRGYGLTWVIASERQDRDVIHYHTLFGGDPRLDNISKKGLARKWWIQGMYEGEQKFTGLARIESPYRECAVARYVSKYIAKTGVGADVFVPARILRSWSQQKALRWVPVG